MMKLGMTKDHLDNLVAIHPTNADIFTDLTDKASGKDPLDN